MAGIAPFRGIRYDPRAVGELGLVVSPPYDVIGEAEREALEAASPYNVVRLVLPGSPDAGPGKYTQARALLETWLAAGVLRRDDEAALYLYEQRSVIEGRPHLQRGVLAAVSIESSSGAILPHERTYEEVVADRLALLRATEANLDPVFFVYEGTDAGAHEAMERAERAEAAARFRTRDGVEHALRPVHDPATIDAIARSVEKATLVIADGHHRFETARRHREERRAAEGAGPWDSLLVFLVDASRFGPALLPIHRVVAGIGPDDAIERMRAAFALEPVAGGAVDLARSVAERRPSGRAFGVFARDRAWIATLTDARAAAAALPADRSGAWRDLDVSVLHHFVFERLLGGADAGFVHDASEVADLVASGSASLGFLLAAVPFEAVRAVAEAGESMPPKSTYFVPKPCTGAVIRPLD